MRRVRHHGSWASALRASLSVGGLVLLACLALALGGCGPLTQAEAGPYYPVIRTPTGPTTPTPGPLTYTVGVWPSDSTPPPGGAITIFVSFRNAGKPVPGASVSGVAFYQSHAGARSIGVGPRLTDRQGYASLALPVGNALSPVGKTDKTVLVTVTVSYEGQTYQATTNFTPLP